MKLILLTLFVAVATSAPLDDGGPVELIVTGVAEGEPLEIGDIVDIKVKEHVDGELVSSSNLLYPLTAQGLAEAAAVVAADELPTARYHVEAESDTPYNIEVVTLPEIEAESIMSAPEPVLPEVVEVIEAPAVLNVLPEAAAQVANGEVYNDGKVQVTVNVPEDAGVLATVQSWFNMVLNYFSNGFAVSQQIV